MGSVVEDLRQLLEDIDVAEIAGSIALGERERCGEKKRRRILWEHRTVKLAETIREKAGKALNLMKCEKLEAAVEHLHGSRPGGGAGRRSAPGDDDRGVWLNFYEELKEIQDLHRGDGEVGEMNIESVRDSNYFIIQVLNEIPGLTSVFPETESKGRTLDLSGVFDAFINCKKYREHRSREHYRTTSARMTKLRYEREKKRKVAEGRVDFKLEDVQLDLNDPEVRKRLSFHEIDLVKFLRTILSNFAAIPRYCKYRDPDYLNYITVLLEYLSSFYKRLNPLLSWKKLQEDLRRKFEEQWRKGSITHWTPPSCELQGFYAHCTDKLFGKESACTGHIGSAKYKKAENRLTDDERAEILLKSQEHDRDLARLEFYCTFYLEKLTPWVEATIQHIRKKQSRVFSELVAEAENKDSEDEEDYISNILTRGGGTGGSVEPSKGKKRDGAAVPESDSDEETPAKKIRNPLNLPLGWDGKPIPYWLYKLHGLSQEFTCEICGNQRYWGRLVFERHFQEWRHAFGMRCLKIPNTVHFKEITRIEDALALYDKVKAEADARAFLADQEVEVEDAQGNVMTPQTYEDLRKQGLL